MNSWGERPEDDRDEAWVVQELRRVISAGPFDHGALVRGAHLRARALRRRRALATGASVAVLGPAVVGAAALVLPGLLPSGTGLPAAASLDASGPRNETVAGPSVAVATTTPHTSPTSTSTTTPVATTAPWQDGALPLPAGGMDTAHDDSRWPIPDARPTGVGHLDALGAPTSGMAYRAIVPISGVMECNTGAVDAEPLAGQSWSYVDESGGLGPVDLQVTGWADSRAARDALRDGTMTFCVRDTEWRQLDWHEHDGDDDYLLYRASPAGLGEIAFALVRQGDYLVGVSVHSGSDEGSRGTAVAPAEVAAEIASRTADNLAALDPAHGRD